MSFHTKNKVQFVGDVVKPELAYLPTGTAKLTFSLKINEFKPGKDGEGSYEDTWINNLVVFGKLAENMHKLCPAKTYVLAAGYFQPEKWTDKEGKTRYSYSFVINEFLVLKKAPGETSAQEYVNDSDYVPGVDDTGIPF